MDNTIVVAILGFLGTCVGTIGGILATSKLTNYRLQELEKKVDKHNTLIDRMYKVEARVTLVEDELKGGK